LQLILGQRRNGVPGETHHDVVESEVRIGKGREIDREVRADTLQHAQELLRCGSGWNVWTTRSTFMKAGFSRGG
jgi:hypothetical protein